MKTFHLTVAKVGENLFDGEVVSASFPGVEGAFEILAGHEAFVSELHAGKARIKTVDERVQEIEILHGGIAEVSQNQATILLP
ncbi:MAG: FoF1 ATP synthase subunit delta/epsilon [Minisyncoccota bacterium]